MQLGQFSGSSDNMEVNYDAAMFVSNNSNFCFQIKGWTGHNFASLFSKFFPYNFNASLPDSAMFYYASGNHIYFKEL